MRICSIASGSSGNCIYVGSDNTHVIIDAGISGKRIEEGLNKIGLKTDELDAVLLTHEHSDHIQGLRVFAARHGIRVYASEGTARAMQEKGIINDKVDITSIGPGTVETDNARVTPFRISHDCAEGYGYVVETSDGRRTCFATDTGYVSPELFEAIKGCDTAVIESNHDIGMLESGAYPYILKKRILSDIGHLSNESCAKTAAELVKSGTTRFLLAHLSRENNIPELARETSVCTLTGCGMKQNIDFMLSVAKESGNKMMMY